MPPKNLKKINPADANFLMWFQGQKPALSLDEGKKQYLEEVNVRRKAKYAKHLEEYQSYLDSLKNMGAIPDPAASEHSPPPSRLTTLSKNSIKNRPTPQNIFSQSFPPQSDQPPPKFSFPEQSLLENFIPEQSFPEHTRPPPNSG